MKFIFPSSYNVQPLYIANASNVAVPLELASNITKSVSKGNIESAVIIVTVAYPFLNASQAKELVNHLTRGQVGLWQMFAWSQTHGKEYSFGMTQGTREDAVARVEQVLYDPNFDKLKLQKPRVEKVS